jgi:hypothetical protein
MTTKTGLVFFSYASKNLSEVERLDLALRRRGVPLWRDRTSLGKGVLTGDEIDQAAACAVGFAFYLTREAAHSEWVRERERSAALKNAKLDSSFGIIPIFRHDTVAVTGLMQSLAQTTTGDRNVADYDLRSYNGHMMDEQAFNDGAEEKEFVAAAEVVLRALLRTKVKQSANGSALRIGAMTRNGPLVQGAAVDLLLDWTADFPPGAARLPNPHVAEIHLLSALQSSARTIVKEWVPHRGSRLLIIPQCHLSFAVALGYQFRRNTGFDLDVVEPQSGEHWNGPVKPMQPASDYWEASCRSSGSAGLAVMIGISRSVRRDAELSIARLGLDIGEALVFEPAAGVSLSAIPHGHPYLAHQMAVAVMQKISQLQAKSGSRRIHLFAAVPAAFAVLLGQQLSSVGPIQLYEWDLENCCYAPTFPLI